MRIFRARHDNVPESPVRTLYGRKGNLLLVPLDVCILQSSNGKEEFRPPTDAGHLIAAPLQHEDGRRLGLIAGYEWPPRLDALANPVVTVQLAPSANLKGVPDLRVLASQFRLGDAVYLSGPDAAAPAERTEGRVVALPHLHEYPDLMHQVRVYGVDFQAPLPLTAHGAAVHRASGELMGMLISTQNQLDGSCRALIYPA